MADVTILTMSEFGRTVRQNGNGGTDHGHASAMFVIGGDVKGKKVHGKWPGLEPEQLYEGRDLALTTDFRVVFSEVAAKHLGASEAGRAVPGIRGRSRRAGSESSVSRTLSGAAATERICGVCTGGHGPWQHGVTRRLDSAPARLEL